MQFDLLKRRELIALLGGAAVGWPLAARGQQPAMPVIGLLNSGPKDEQSLADAFRKGLSEVGYIDGKNLAIEYRWADYQYDRLPQLAAELVRRKVAVIAAVYTPATRAAMTATSETPIVFVVGVDPVRSGLVSSLNRPGANVTGFAIFGGMIGAKRLGLLHDLLPSAGTVALLINPTNRLLSEPYVNDVQVTARTLGVQLVVLRASTDGEIDNSFATMIEQRISALMVGPDALLRSRCAYIAAVALRHAIIAIYPWREGPRAGGLMSYDTDFSDAFRQQGGYVGRILNGAKPGDLPVQNPTKFELTINLRTARALGISIPPSLLATADEVIE